MRVAVLADIHSNLAALQAVLHDARAQGADEYWCLGDIVGYGPEPSACVSAIRETVSLVIAGNHDLGVAGRIGLEEFNPYAAEAARWTMQQVPEEEKGFLGGLPSKTEYAGVTLAHGSPRDPVWEYVLSVPAAAANFPLFNTRVCLVGHSHVPFMCLQAERNLPCSFYSFPEGLGLSVEGQRAIINPGSVGQPRDRDPRASYLLYDRGREVFLNRRVTYDFGATQRRMREAGLPHYLINRLSQGT